MAEVILTDPKQAVSDLTGIAAAEIGVSTLQVDILKREGVLINLDITGTSMFVVGTDWGELGVAGDSTRAQRMTPGRKYLYPKAQVNRLNSVVSAMRQALERYTFDLAGFRPSRYMHYKVYKTWRDEWQLLLGRFNDVKQDLVAMHEQAVDELAEEFRAIAEEAWKSNLGTGADMLIFGGQAYDDLDEFTDAVVAKALSKMPAPETIEEKLQADYRVSMLYGLEEIARAEAAATRIREQAEAEVARARAEKQAAYLVEAAAQEQFNHEQRMLRMAEQEKELAIEAMMHAEAEHAREQLQQIASPFFEVFSQMRGQIAQDAGEMLESVKKNGFVKGRVAERARGLLELFELMSVQDDAELREKLVRLREQIGPVGEERTENAPARSTEQIMTTLEEITQLAHAAVQDLAAGPSRFAFLE